MIWFWITSALMLSLFFLRKKKIRFHHYIFLLIPIDFYGIQIGGVLLRLYMVFTIVLIVIHKEKPKLRIKKRYFNKIITLILLFFLSDLFNGMQSGSIMQHLMVAASFFCALTYISYIKFSKESEMIIDVIASTGLGFSIIYLIAVLFRHLGINLDGVHSVSYDLPYTDGIIREMYGMPFGRLRGFQIDPNLLATSLLPPTIISLYRIISNNANKLRNYAQVIMSLLCAYYSNSRMALASYSLVLSGAFLFFLKSEKKQKKISTILTFIMILVIICFSFFFYAGEISDGIKTFFSKYQTRANFSEEHGRGTIWLTNLGVMLKTNFWAGVGQGQIRNITSIDNHNTWLEYFVGNGIFAGIFSLSFFFGVLFLGIRYSNRRKHDKFIALLNWGYIGILMSLTTADNVANPNMVFYTCLILWWIGSSMNHADS